MREHARHHIEAGAVTENYGADRDIVLRLLNKALATEIVCNLRYRRHYYTARGLASASIAAEFMEHAREEEAHAERFAERIAIESYRETIQYIGGNDPTTRRLFEEILAVEEGHADELLSLIQQLGTHSAAS